MNNQYKLKDKKISVWSFTDTTIKGVVKRIYAKEYENIWAYYRHNRGTAYFKDSNDLTVYDDNAAALFVINNRSLDINWLITYKSRIYEIVRIDDFEGYHDDIKVYCKLADNQDPGAYQGLAL